MEEKLLALDLPPGFVNNGTKYLSRGRWYSGNFVRFNGKAVQPIGGWEQRTLTGDAIVATATGAISWALNGVGVIAFGSGNGLRYVDGSDVVTDITPAVLSGSADSTVYWQLEMFGSYLIACYLPTRTLFFWDPSVGGAASFPTPWAATGPASANAVVTTPERFFFALGDTDGNHVRWPSQESYTDWTPAATNSAGDFTLETRGDLICGRAARGATLLWTTKDLWSATFIGQPLIYSFAKVGDFCGAISTYSPVMIDTTAYWMGHGKFFRYDGQVQPIPCDVEDYVFGNIATAYNYKIWGLANPLFGEVTWFYPTANATDCDRYVTYDYENGHWTFGSMERSTGVTAQVQATPQVPVLFTPAGAMYDHETGTSHGGASPSVESGPIELGDGDRVMRIQRIVPDDKTAGDVSASLYTSMHPNDAETENGPYTLASPTSVRLTARQARLKLTEATAAAWRVGTVRLGVREGGKR